MSSQRIAVVTGAGTGIGRATALKLLSLGDRVYLTGRHADTLEETASQAAGFPGSPVVHSLDVTDESAVRGLFETIERDCGRVDLLFNNAGFMVVNQSPDEMSGDDWRRIVDVNLSGLFYCTKYAFALMRKQDPQGGRIINNGSISAHAPRPGSAGYTATKHAVSGVTKSTSLDGRPYSICCGQIDIGNAETPLTAAVPAGVPQADGHTATEPLMDVKHVADAVAFMASLPLDTNVHSLCILPRDMPFVGRG